MNKKILIATSSFLAILIILSTFTGGVYLGRVIEKHEALLFSRDLSPVKKVEEVLDIINQEYVEKASNKKLSDGAIEGMIAALDDPYTRYLTAKDFDMFKEETSGHFDGVGIVISEAENKEIVVVSPIEGAPAQKAGIKAHDVITKVNDKPTKGMTADQAASLIRGKRGTKVTLTVRREGENEPLVFTLVRQQINIPNVVSKKLSKDIGYLQLHQFNEQTSDELKTHYEKLKSQGVKGVVFDLRNNPGGLLEEAIDVGSMWIRSGAIVKIQSREGDIESKDATGGADTQMPLVVIVNKGSASASEIVSGALQDYKRAVIVGESTFGKASVQTVFNLSDGSGVLLTTDKYLTPNGRMIHKKGIKPDVAVKFNHKDKKDMQLEKATEVMQELISGKRNLKSAAS